VCTDFQVSKVPPERPLELIGLAQALALGKLRQALRVLC
jgi:hypothetical protein